MVHARLVRPPSSAAKLVAMDESSLKDIPGLVKVVQRGDFIGVVAEREEQAIQAAKQLKVEWQETPVYPRMRRSLCSITQPADRRQRTGRARQC